MSVIDMRMVASSCGPSHNYSGGSSSRTSRLTSAGSDAYAFNPFGFDSKISFDANRELTLTRSDKFTVKPSQKDDDIWKKPPPDFRPQVYAPKPPKRNSRDAMKPWKYGTFPGHKTQKREKEKVFLPNILESKAAEERRMLTRFHIMDPDEARMHFCSNGMNEAGSFNNPQLHNFRPLPTIKSLGLPEFETRIEPDPFNLKFNSEHLQIIHGLATKPPSERDIKGQQMAPPLHQPPKWEQRLHLPRYPFPTPYGAYTRYRLPWRSPEQVVMDHMEETLCKEWEKENKQRQMEKPDKQKLENVQSDNDLDNDKIID